MKSWIWHGGWDKVNYTFIPDASGANNLGFLAGGKFLQDEQRGLVLELNGKRKRVEIMNSADINTGKAYPQRSIAFGSVRRNSRMATPRKNRCGKSFTRKAAAALA